jgi:hypothetical protein
MIQPNPNYGNNVGAANYTRRIYAAAIKYLVEVNDRALEVPDAIAKSLVTVWWGRGDETLNSTSGFVSAIAALAGDSLFRSCFNSISLNVKLPGNLTSSNDILRLLVARLTKDSNFLRYPLIFYAAMETKDVQLARAIETKASGKFPNADYLNFLDDNGIPVLVSPVKDIAWTGKFKENYTYASGATITGQAPRGLAGINVYKTTDSPPSLAQVMARMEEYTKAATTAPRKEEVKEERNGRSEEIARPVTTRTAGRVRSLEAEQPIVEQFSWEQEAR